MKKLGLLYTLNLVILCLLLFSCQENSKIKDIDRNIIAFNEAVVASLKGEEANSSLKAKAIIKEKINIKNAIKRAVSCGYNSEDFELISQEIIDISNEEKKLYALKVTIRINDNEQTFYTLLAQKNKELYIPYSTLAEASANSRYAEELPPGDGGDIGGATCYNCSGGQCCFFDGLKRACKCEQGGDSSQCILKVWKC